MVVNEAEFKKHLKTKEFQNLYIITGVEKFLVKHYTNTLLTKLMRKESPEFNYHTLDDSCEINQIAVSVDVVPFMSEYNCVKITDLNVEKLKKDDFDSLKEIIKNIPKTTIVIFTFPTLDISGKNYNSLITLGKKQGVVADFQRYDSHSLSKQLVDAAYKRGCTITLANAGKIVDYTGTDLTALQNEIDKLSAYADGGEITLDMIDSLVHINLETKVYYMADHIICNRVEKAYRELDILFYQKTEPISIVSAIATAYIDLYRSRVAGENGVPLSTVAKDFSYGKREFVLSKAARSGKRISTKALRKSISEIINTDQKLKSTTSDGRILVEKLIAKLTLIAGEG